MKFMQSVKIKQSTNLLIQLPIYSHNVLKYFIYLIYIFENYYTAFMLLNKYIKFAYIFLHSILK